MKHIIRVSDTHDAEGFRLRLAARGVLVLGDEICLLRVKKFGYYKLPGGGVDKGETFEDALKREILEETGCTMTIRKFLGTTMEERDEQAMLQETHVYLMDVVKKVGEPDYTEKEKNYGFSVIWVKPKKAKKLLMDSSTEQYSSQFIIKRDLAIVEYAEKFI